MANETERNAAITELTELKNTLARMKTLTNQLESQLDKRDGIYETIEDTSDVVIERTNNEEIALKNIEKRRNSAKSTKYKIIIAVSIIILIGITIASFVFIAMNKSQISYDAPKAMYIWHSLFYIILFLIEIIGIVSVITDIL